MDKIIFGCTPSTEFTNVPTYTNIIKIPEKYSYVSVMPPIENQGQTSKCVAYSICSWLDWRKNIGEHDNNGNQFNVDTIYGVRRDKSANGMMITEALHFLTSTDLSNYKINGYSKIGSIECAKTSLIVNGPVIAGMGVHSYNSDFWNGAENMGGHCILIVGYNENGFIIRNSWGNLFGNKGYTLLPYNKFKSICEAWTIKA